MRRRLDTITLRVPAGAGRRSTCFTYNSGLPRGSIIVRGGQHADRRDRRTTTLTDPSGQVTKITTRTAQRAVHLRHLVHEPDPEADQPARQIIEFAYDAAKKVASGRVYMTGATQGGSDLITAIRTVEVLGFVPNATDSALTYVRLDGPRSDVPERPSTT